MLIVVVSGYLLRGCTCQLHYLLSNIDGIFTGHPDDPQSKIIPFVAPGRDLSEYIQTEKSAFGRGGMHSKYTTATRVQQSGIKVIIANGKRENILIDLINRKDSIPHTEFEVKEKK